MRIIAACLLVSCAPDAPPSPLDIEVELAGCAAIAPGPVCEVRADRELVAWVVGPVGATLHISTDDGAIEPSPEAIQGGQRFRFTVPPSARTLVIEARRRGALGRWRHRLRPAAPHPVIAAARAARKRGEAAQAKSALVSALPGLQGAARAEALGLLARLERAAGRTEPGLAHLREAIDAFHAAGYLSRAVDESGVLAYVLRHDVLAVPEAQAALDRAEAWAARYPEGRARLAHHQSLVAREGADPWTALRASTDAIQRAERLGMTTQLRFARQARASILQVLGRAEEAAVVLRAVLTELGPGGSPCLRAQALNNLGWGLALAEEARGGPQGGEADPLPALEEAARLYDARCDRPKKAANVLVSLAFALTLRGRSAEARGRLAAARAKAPELPAFVAIWEADLAGRMALEAGEPREALAHYRALARRAEVTQSAEMAWRAEVGQGFALAALDEPTAALAAFERAETLVTTELLRLPFDAGRETIASRRARASRRALSLLLAAGRVDDALTLARRARGRVLAQLRRATRLATLPAAERARWDAAVARFRRARAALEADQAGDWRLDVEALERVRVARRAQRAALRRHLDEALAVLAEPEAKWAPLRPAPDELIVLYHPLPEGWVGFAINAQGVSVHRLGAVDPTTDPRTLTSLLLTPFATQLAQARHVRVLASGALRALDLHALPWHGGPLIQHVTVSYALDLPPVGPAATERRALVVADPGRNLPGARAEAAEVARALAGPTGGWSVRALSGVAATRRGVLEALPTADLLHYAGHGLYAGRGWASSLPLVDGRLSVGDVLAAARVPRRVVFSACEAARSADAADVESLGLAQAFLVAGAEQVIASPRPLDDASARRLIGAVYQAAVGEGGMDLRAALRIAQARLQGSVPEWAALRVWTR